MSTTYVWHLWPGRHWPASAAEEEQFVAELRIRAAGQVGDHERMDVTAVLNALRCGIAVTDTLRFAPGMSPAALLGAYTELEGRRNASAAAWDRIVAAPTLASITDNAALASRLLPVPVYRLVTAASIVTHGSLARVVASVHAEIRQAVARAAGVEHTLARRRPPDDHAVALGAVLHNPHEPGLWGHPYYLPARVGALSPLRVADLLGERA